MKLNEIKLLNENAFPTNKRQIEDLLQELGIDIRNCTIQPDGVVDVVGNINVSFAKFERCLVQFGKVEGNFIWKHSDYLKTLEGFPTEVTGGFDCSFNELTSLEFSPTIVKSFNCSGNKLTSLEYAPMVREGFDCANNLLTTLEGAPKEIPTYFHCYNNKLTSLQYAPRIIGSSFNGGDNPITSLEGISDIIDSVEEFDIWSSTKHITSGGIGLILIENLKNIRLPVDNMIAEDIIRYYLGKPNDIFDCQNELIEAGFEEYAKL